MSHASQIAAWLFPSVKKRALTVYQCDQAAQKSAAKTPTQHSFSQQLQQAKHPTSNEKATTPHAHSCTQLARKTTDHGKKHSPTPAQPADHPEPKKWRLKNKKKVALEILSSAFSPFLVQKKPFLSSPLPDHPSVPKRVRSCPIISPSDTQAFQPSSLLVQLSAQKNRAHPMVKKIRSEVWRKQLGAVLTAAVEENKEKVGQFLTHPGEIVDPKRVSLPHSYTVGKWTGPNQKQVAAARNHGQSAHHAASTLPSTVHHDRAVRDGAITLFTTLQQKKHEPHALRSENTSAGGTDAAAYPLAAKTIHSPMAIQLPVTHPSWSHALTQSVALLVRQGIPEATVSVHPHHLGPVKIHLVWENHIIHTSFFCHNGTIKQIIESSLPTLQHMLSQTGIQLGHTNVSAQSQFMHDQPAFSAVPLQHPQQPVEDTNLPTALLTSRIDVFA